MKKNNNNIYIILFIIIFIIFLICSIYYLKKKNIESFFNAKTYILDNCNSNSFDCNSNTWVSNPAYLCGICGDSGLNPLLKVQNSDGIFYGCLPNAKNNYGLKWKANSNATKVNSFLSSLITCNGFNKGVTSNLYMYVCCDDLCTINVNGTIINQNEGWTVMGGYLFENIKYGDSVTINGTNLGGPAGLAVSYFWNKQLFIMENNGYSTCANIIDYIATGNSGWSSIYVGDIPQLLPWMNNWINYTTTMTLSFNVGYSKNKALLNGDLTLFYGFDDYGSVLVNNKTVSSTTSTTTDQESIYTEVQVPNVKQRSRIQLNGTNAGGPGGLGLFYIWCGAFYCLQSTISGFNSCVNVIQCTTTNTNTYSYDVTGISSGYPFLPMWLNACTGICNYTLSTNITPPNSNVWIYNQTINLWYTPVQNNLIGDWSLTGIKSTASMTVSFWIYISEINQSWRNIFHVSNQNVDCCDSGNRIPAAWICPGDTYLYTRTSDASYGDNGADWSNIGIVLNTPTYVNMVFDNTTITVYFNGNSVGSYTLPSVIINAEPTAQFYISDPWYDSGGYQIQNFSLLNGALSASQILSEYVNLKPTGNSSPIVCGAYNFCVNTQNYGKNYYCYGETSGCLWNTNDCTTDSDCSKYTTSSLSYTDPGGVCQGLTSTTPGGAWQYNACSNT